MPTYLNVDEARQVVNDTIAVIEKKIGKKLSYELHIEFNSRFTRKMGDASRRIRRIRLSGPLFPRATVEKRRNTIIHEVCHILSFEIYGNNIKSHGREWKHLMILAGEVPKRCHNVDRTGLKRKSKKFEVKCSCRIHIVGPIRYRRIQQGLKYRCTICRQALGIESVVKPTTVAPPSNVVVPSTWTPPKVPPNLNSPY